MSDFDDLLYPATVRAKAAIDGKKAFFPYVGDLAAKTLGLDGGEVAERLLERERIGTTAFGKGVALPHARLDNLSGVKGLFLKFEQPIDFDAVDSLPVDLAFILLSPVDCGADHLKALARISRFLRDEDAVERLRGAKSSEALYALLAGGESRDAA
ncbi:MAG: PTS transporter subunit EIIA [Sphingomonadales bacterium]|nr:PTS transporter subunit EIIA [Sphingomonadales bacterium]